MVTPDHHSGDNSWENDVICTTLYIAHMGDTRPDLSKVGNRDGKHYIAQYNMIDIVITHIEESYFLSALRIGNDVGGYARDINTAIKAQLITHRRFHKNMLLSLLHSP